MNKLRIAKLIIIVLAVALAGSVFVNLNQEKDNRVLQDQLDILQLQMAKSAGGGLGNLDKTTSDLSIENMYKRSEDSILNAQKLKDEILKQVRAEQMQKGASSTTTYPTQQPTTTLPTLGGSTSGSSAASGLEEPTSGQPSGNLSTQRNDGRFRDLNKGHQ